jgi:hypothetical protein
MTETTPAHKQLQVQALSSAGRPPIVTAGDPGTQGEAVAGMQGCGVKTPKAADVAAMTCGLLGLLHRPNGLIFTKGAKSMIVAAPALVPLAGLAGGAAKIDGAAPKLQVRMAPSTTRTAMRGTSKQSPIDATGAAGSQRCSRA